MGRFWVNFRVLGSVLRVLGQKRSFLGRFWVVFGSKRSTLTVLWVMHDALFILLVARAHFGPTLFGDISYMISLLADNICFRPWFPFFNRHTINSLNIFESLRLGSTVLGSLNRAPAPIVMPAKTIGYSQLNFDSIFIQLFIYLILLRCFIDGLRGKVPNDSLRGNKIVINGSYPMLNGAMDNRNDMEA